MFSTYARRCPGQAYLNQVLLPHISKIFSNPTLNLEIDPYKIYHELVRQQCAPAEVPHDQIPSLQQVQELVRTRSAALQDLVASVQESIFQSLPNIPYGMRWICKQIRSNVRRKDPSISDMELSPLIGAAFYLRFLNPAIVSPQAYRLVDEPPSGNAQRTLMLVAKTLQSLVNNSPYKENFMKTMQPFMDANRTRMCSFLHNLCNVGDFYDTLELDQYMALTQKNLTINISLNEIYRMHSLLFKHLDSLAPNADDRLRIIMNDLGPAPNAVPRAKDYNIELPLFSRWEMPIHDWSKALLSESNLTQSDILFMETKSIFVKLIRSMPHLTRDSPFHLCAVLTCAANSQDKIVIRKGARAHNMLLELVNLRAIDATTFEPLAEEIAAELQLLRNSRNEVAKELESLRGVLNSLHDQNSYLLGQLDSYKSYLQNARITSGTSNHRSSFLGPLGVVSVRGRSIRRPWVWQSAHCHRYTYYQLEQELLIEKSLIPADRCVKYG